MGTYEFDGEKYKKASRHQKEWGNKLISSLQLKGNEAILDLGCGDGILTEQLSLLVPDGYVLGIDASVGMIEKAEQNVHDNLKFMQCVPDETKKEFRDEVVEEMLSKALQPDGTCFETFRRINVRLVK